MSGVVSYNLLVQQETCIALGSPLGWPLLFLNISLGLLCAKGAHTIKSCQSDSGCCKYICRTNEYVG